MCEKQSSSTTMSSNNNSTQPKRKSSESSVYQNATFSLTWLKAAVHESWASAHEPGEKRTRLLAAARSICGIILLVQYYYTALCIAILASIYPNVAGSVVKMMDDMINGLLAGLPAWNRYVQPLVVIILIVVTPNMPILSSLGAIVASKLAAEFAYRNHKKEECMAITAQLTDEEF